MKERIDEKTILKYLPGLSRDICERSGISRQHTNICLKRLLDQNLVEIEKIVKVRGTPAPYYRLKKNECTNIILSLFGSGEEWSVTELTEKTMLERKFVVSAVKSLSSKKKIKIVRRQKNGKIREGIYRILQEQVIPKPSAKRSQPLTESVMCRISCLWDNAVRHVMKISG